MRWRCPPRSPTARDRGHRPCGLRSLSRPGPPAYDAAGEVTTDQYSNSYSYNAEGRILSGGSGTYVYDGDGNRVKKTVSGTTTLYWPGAGSLLNESNSSGSTMGKQVSFAGLLVWHEDTSGNGLFLFHDHLGSTRVTGDASGNLHDDNDYRSYGMLSSNYGASPSDNHYLFTGYESDSETTSDYAVNRNFGMTLGRFNRPDPYDGSYDATNPQSLNRYTYALNNPLVLVDPSGLYECYTLAEEGISRSFPTAAMIATVALVAQAVLRVGVVQPVAVTFP